MTVYVTGSIYQPALDLLAQHAEIVRTLDNPEKIDAMIIRGGKVTEEMMDLCPNLKVIARHGIGVDSVDVPAATKRKIPVLNTPLTNADSVAELVVGLFLLLSRRLYEANVMSRDGSFEQVGRAKFLGLEMQGKTFGQIGMGNIAQRIAKIMQNGFGCRVLGYDPFVDAAEAEKRGFIKCETMEELLEQSDYVNVNVPLIPSTMNMISREKMEHFKQGAFFVNAARGGVADEDALYDALVSGRLSGAACDTFVGGEPVRADHKLLSLPNFSATPHIGGNTEEALQKTGMEVVQITLDYLAGKPVKSQVNKF